MKKLIVLSFLLLVGCTVTPEEPEQPEGYNDAKIELVERIKDNPTDITAHADLLQMQRQVGDVEGARITVAHCIKHNKDDFRTWLIAAEYYRWQNDLLDAEKALRKSRDLEPARLEPRVALSGLYSNAYMEAEELEQRELAVQLADDVTRPELQLDLAYAAAGLGKPDRARELATTIIANGAASDAARSRSHVLLVELDLQLNKESDAVQHALAAWRLQPRYEGLIQYCARLVTVLKDGAELAIVFKATLESLDRMEHRWAALFGLWMIDVQAAINAEKPALNEDSEGFYKRLSEIDPAHPDVLSRRYQLLSLNAEKEDEFKVTQESLEKLKLGLPPLVKTPVSLLSLWRAQDSLRMGAPTITLAECDQLEVRQPDIVELRLMRLLALFRNREDDVCLSSIEEWMGESDEPDEFLQNMRWWIMLRHKRAGEVLSELNDKNQKPSNSMIWIKAVAKFQLYRKS
jgi:tetratricopeptide (TPR) repeat protein